jgi:rhodanese-related sulfurtransferase
MLQPLLLLDVREPEAFERCHIMEALNHPARLFNRDTLTPELFRSVRGVVRCVSQITPRVCLRGCVSGVQKNKSDCMVVLYDDGERLASACSKQLSERGFENVFILSGGLQVLGNKFPLLLTAPLPDELKEAPPKGAASAYTCRRCLTAASLHPVAPACLRVRRGEGRRLVPQCVVGRVHVTRQCPNQCGSEEYVAGRMEMNRFSY